MKDARTFWLFGLSGAGKSTLAALFAQELRGEGLPVFRLDGDVMRSGLSSDLGFDDRARLENIRRAACVAKMANDQGMIVIASFITPLQTMRNCVRDIVGPENLSLVFVDAPLALCAVRDPKGLYKKKQTGAIKNFTGFDSDFEVPRGSMGEVFHRVDCAHYMTQEFSLKELLSIARMEGLL